MRTPTRTITISNNWLRIDGVEFLKTTDAPPARVQWQPTTSGAPIHVAKDGRWARIVDSETGATSSVYARAVSL